MRAPSKAEHIDAGSATQRRLRIGIDGTCLALRRGYGRYLRELLPNLLERNDVHEYLLFIDKHSTSSIGTFDLPIVEVDTSIAQTESASARGNRSVLDLWRMGRAVQNQNLDVMYFPSVYSYYPVPRRIPVAVALHDTIAERHAGIVFPSWRNSLAWKAKVYHALKRARAIITVSEWSRQSLGDWFGIPTELIHVTPEAASPEFHPVHSPEKLHRWLAEHRIHPTQPYLLYVGGFNPHKNLPLFVRAFASLKRQSPHPELKLILVGDYAGDLFHSTVQALRSQIRSLSLTDKVHFAGFVPDQELRHLYAGAIALVLPSLEEGFGLPAVEAAACGTPCVATKNSPLPQLLHNGGIFVNPTSLEELEAALSEIVSNLPRRDELAAGALESVQQLTWTKTADATRRALESAAIKP